MIILPLALNNSAGKHQRCRRCRDILDCYAGRVSRSGKMAIKKVEKIKALHLLML